MILGVDLHSLIVWLWQFISRWEIWSWDFIGWFFVNLIVPVGLPPLGILIVRMMKIELSEEVKKKTTFWATIQDGQLGWIALAWAAAAVYELYDALVTGKHAPWMGLVILSEFIIVLMGIAISAGGAVTASDKERDSNYLPIRL